jgi:hypothetical protein
MLTAAIILTTVSLVLLALGIRGRTTARGIFCRRCRFDLAGLDHARTPTCPECGRPTNTPRATTTVLRKPRPLAAVAGAAMMLLAAALFAIQVPALAAKVLPRASDTQLLWLDRAGLRPVRSEIVARLSDVVTARPAFAPLIDAALEELLSGKSPPADRHTEIIKSAWAGAQFTDAQLQRLLNDRIELSCVIRDFAPPGSDTVPISVHAHLRFADLRPWLGADQTPPGTKILLQADRGGPIDETELFLQNRIVSTKVHNLSDWETGFPTMNMPLNPTPQVAQAPARRVHAGLRLVAENQRTGAQLVLRELIVEQTVRLIPMPDLQIPPEQTDPAVLERFIGSLTMKSVNRMSMDRWTDSHAEISFTVYVAESPPFDVAYRIYAALPGRPPEDTGQVLTLDSTRPRDRGSMGYSYVANAMNNATPPETSPLAQTWRHATTADFHLIPDPDSAYLRPPIGPILAIPLIIRNVPVVTQEATFDAYAQHAPIQAELLASDPQPPQTTQ